MRLYVVPASHPCAAVESALRMKGFDYKVTELLPGMHAAHQRIRFGKRTVPSLKLDGGEKVSGSTAIMRRLEELRPEPTLWPDPRVEAVERWGDEVHQPLVRRLVWFSLRRQPGAMPSFLADSKLPVPPFFAKLAGPMTSMIEWRLNGVTEAAVRADVEQVPSHLERVSGWIGEGVIGGETPNAADLQIGASVALLRTIGDLREQVDASPAGTLASRWFPGYPGSIPAGTLS